MIEPILYLYVKQDGMYDTEDLLITDEYKSQDDLPPYWFRTGTKATDFNQLVLCAYQIFFDNNFKHIRYNVEDEYIIDMDTIKRIFPEELI